MSERVGGNETDAALMGDVREGNLSQLNLLFCRYDQKLFNFFFRMTGSREASEDLTQEVFMRILKYRMTFRPEQNFRTWMYQIARNVNADYASRQDKEDSMDESCLEAMGPVTEPTDLARQQEREALLFALAKLPAEKREVLVLARFQGLKSEEIGAILGCSASTARVRVFRAVEDLRKIFFTMIGETTLWNVHR